MRRALRPMMLIIVIVVFIGAIFFVGKPRPSSAQNEGFKSYQLLIFCGDSSLASATFWQDVTAGGTVGRPLMGLKTVCAGKKCSGGPVTLANALAQFPSNVSRAMQAKVDKYQENLAAGEGWFLTCLVEDKKPPAAKCDKKKACDTIDAMQKVITKYEGLLGNLPGSFAELNAQLSKLMQQLSEALACRYNEGHDAADAKILNDFIGQLLKDKNGFSTLNSQAKVPQQISCDSDLGNPGSNECRDYQTLQRIRENLSRFAGVLGCKGPPQSNAPKADCKELSNGVLDGLATFFDEMDKLKPKNQIGSGDSYDQVADGIQSALKELEDAAKEIEGTGGTGAQQYKDLQGKIGKLKKLLDVWGQMKAASCLPKDVEQLLRKLAAEKKAGTEHKATCTELCAATADWFVKLTGQAQQHSPFFKACSLACF